jgi:hypothetical protein
MAKPVHATMKIKDRAALGDSIPRLWRLALR